jgi:hypothetical protein
MKTKRKAKVSIVDAVYETLHDVEDSSDKQLIRHVSKRCGTRISTKQFKRALVSVRHRV